MTELVRVTPTTFASGTWRAAPPSRDPLEHTLRIATLNVCFEPRHRAERTRALVAAIEAWDADVIALQELTRPVLELLRASESVREAYDVAVGSMAADYGVALLSRAPFTDVRELELPSLMGRSLLVGRWGEAAARLAIGTVHLESTRELGASRIRQLDLVTRALETEPNVVLVGDMNFDPRDPEEAARDPRFVDAWSLLRPGEPGWTEDTETNALRRLAEGGRTKQVRYDRAFVRGPRLRARRAELMGTAPLDAASGPTSLSDHFGLLVELDLDHA